MPTIDAHFSNWCAKENVLVGSSGSGSGSGGGGGVPLILKLPMMTADKQQVEGRMTGHPVARARKLKLTKLLQLRKQLADHHRQTNVKDGEIKEQEERQKECTEERNEEQKEEQEQDQIPGTQQHHQQQPENPQLEQSLEETLQQFKQNILSSKMYKKLERLDRTTALPNGLLEASFKKYKVPPNCHLFIRTHFDEWLEIARDFLDSDSENENDDRGLSKPLSIEDFLRWLND